MRAVEAEMPKQLVLDRHHVRQQQAVGIARARRADRDVVDDGAAAHRDDPVGERQRLVHVMGDEDDGRDGAAGLLPQVEQHVLQLMTGHIVERAERLVEQQHAPAIGEHGGDRHPLQHAAREFARPGALDMREPDPPEVVARDQAALPWRQRRGT